MTLMFQGFDFAAAPLVMRDNGCDGSKDIAFGELVFDVTYDDEQPRLYLRTKEGLPGRLDPYHFNLPWNVDFSDPRFDSEFRRLIYARLRAVAHAAKGLRLNNRD